MRLKLPGVPWRSVQYSCPRMLLCWLLICVAAGTASAAQVDQNFRRWFDQQWAVAADFPDFGDVMVAWSLELPPFDPSERAAAVARARAAGSDVVVGPITRRLWSRGQGKWRLNEDYPTQKAPTFTDTVISPDHAWRMGRDFLSIAESRRGEHRDELEGSLNQFWPELGSLLYGGLTQLKRGGLEPAAFELNGSDFAILFVTPKDPESSRLEIRLTGRWDAGRQQGFPARMQFVRHPLRRDREGAARELHGWMFNDVLGRWVAREYRELSPAGALERVIRFEGASKEERPYDRLFLTPDDSSVDALRGPVTFRQVNDHRNRVSVIRSEDSVRTIEMPRVQDSRISRQRIGWVVAGALAVVLLWLYIRRRAG
jgi:hypothetical protein